MSWNPLWDDIYRSRSWGNYPGEDVVRFVMTHFGRVADRGQVRLLEVGSGPGANLWFMAREGFSVHGVEGSETAVRLCNDRLDRECPGWRTRGGRVQAGDLAALPYEDGYFDAVLDVVAVCYSTYAQAQVAYRELARVTRQGGRLFSRTFAKGCWGDGTGEEVEPGMWVCNEGHLKGFGATRFTSRGDVAALVQGWVVERVESSAITEEDGRYEITHLLIHGTKP